MRSCFFLEKAFDPPPPLLKLKLGLRLAWMSDLDMHTLALSTTGVVLGY